MKKTISFLVAVASVSMVTACQKGKPVSAVRDDVKAVDLRDFPLTDKLVTKSNKIFLWPTDMQGGASVREANRISRAIDAFEDEQIEIGKELLPLNDVLKEVLAFEGVTVEKRKEVTLAQKRREALEKLCAKQCSESQRATLAKLVDDLDRRCDAPAEGTADTQDCIPGLKQTLEIYEGRLSRLADQTDPTGEKRAKRLELQAKVKESQSQAADKAQELQQWVNYYAQPDSIEFAPKADGTISVKIENWEVFADLNKRTFSTESLDGETPTIRNVAYERRGGVFTFEVNVDGDLYAFKFGRTGYDPRGGVNGRALKTGRVYFAGTFTRSSDGRQGIVKLVDFDLKVFQ